MHAVCTPLAPSGARLLRHRHRTRLQFQDRLCEARSQVLFDPFADQLGRYAGRARALDSVYRARQGCPFVFRKVAWHPLLDGQLRFFRQERERKFVVGRRVVDHQPRQRLLAACIPQFNHGGDDAVMKPVARFPGAAFRVRRRTAFLPVWISAGGRICYLYHHILSLNLVLTVRLSGQANENLNSPIRLRS